MPARSRTAPKTPKKRAAPHPWKSRSASAARKSSARRWVRTVTTDSTHPPEGLFNKSASVIARKLASKKVSPKGPSSGMRMLTYFINRAGKGLSASRKKELERAKHLLHQRIERQRQKPAA